MGTRRFAISLLTGLICMIVFGSPTGIAQAIEDEDEEDVEFDVGGPQQQTGAPRRHFRLRQVAHLEPEEANRIYALINGALAKGYGSSGFEDVDKYQSFIRHNKAPYLSSTHGNLYLNNYANQIADNYGEFEQAGELPVGSVIFKDSFSVTEVSQSFSDTTESRQIVLGPLFVMRKMERGFNRVTGDWQYIKIQPDGKVIGMTGGAGAERVEYCIGCHLAREDFDHLYFIPEDYR